MRPSSFPQAAAMQLSTLVFNESDPEPSCLVKIML